MDLVELTTPALSSLGGDVSAGAGMGSFRSWIVALVVVFLVAAFGWWLRRPKRRRQGPTSSAPTVEGPLSPQPPGYDSLPVVRGPDDDEDFLRSISRHRRPHDDGSV